MSRAWLIVGLVAVAQPLAAAPTVWVVDDGERVKRSRCTCGSSSGGTG